MLLQWIKGHSTCEIKISDWFSLPFSYYLSASVFRLMHLFGRCAFAIHHPLSLCRIFCRSPVCVCVSISLTAHLSSSLLLLFILMLWCVCLVGILSFCFEIWILPMSALAVMSPSWRFLYSESEYFGSIFRCLDSSA